MTEKQVYTIPFSDNLDGLNLHTEWYKYVFEKRLDDTRLTEGDDILVTTYPRTGKAWVINVFIKGSQNGTMLKQNE